MNPLRQYLQEHSLTPTQFGEWMKPQVSGRSVQRWLNGTMLPKPAQMAEIYRRTRGAVRPDHFYKLPKLSNGHDRASE